MSILNQIPRGLVQHLRVKHNLPISVTQFKLKNFTDLLEWKKEEKATSSWYVQHCAAQTFNGKSIGTTVTELTIHEEKAKEPSKVKAPVRTHLTVLHT